METVVYTPGQLASAVGTGNDYDYISLGANIQISAFGMTVDPHKTSLVIDGFFGGVIHTLEDANVTTETGTIGIRSASNITLTFKNMIMTGRNNYGIPFVSELADTGGVTVIYDHVTYTGPQITFNPNGLTRYIDCDITISYPAAALRVQEVGEVNRVEFEGRSIIRHNSSPTSLYSAFWFRGALGHAYFKVLQGAEVTISTTNYFMFSMMPVFPPVTQNPVAYEIQPGAGFTLTSYRGISYEASHRASSFLVDTGASFRYIQQAANGSDATLYLNGAFTVNEGASVYMQANFSGSRPLINFIGGADRISVNNPKSFVLYNSADSVVTVGANYIIRPFLIKGGQLNQWNEASPLPGAGDFNDAPDCKWNRPSHNSFSIEGNIALLETEVTDTSLTPEELADLPGLGEFSFQNARVISIGNLPVIPDPAADDGRPISGLTGPGAKLIISYTDGGAEYVFEPTADADGRFSVTPQAPITAGTVITVKANTPFLITVIEITVEEAADEIIIQRAPVRIAFRIPPVSTSPDVLLSRINPKDSVVVLDSRRTGTQWELQASISGPLKTASGEVLERAVVFKDDDGVIRELSDDPVTVYAGGPAAGLTEVYWPAEKGILVRVREPIRSWAEYSAELKWELRLI